MEQHEVFQQKKLVLALDKGIEELQTRITNKRALNQQMQNRLIIQQSSIQQQQLNSPQQKVNSNDNQSSPSKIIPKFATKRMNNIKVNYVLNIYNYHEAYFFILSFD